jgi:hypothetical protein
MKGSRLFLILSMFAVIFGGLFLGYMWSFPSQLNNPPAVETNLQSEGPVNSAPPSTLKLPVAPVSETTPPTSPLESARQSLRQMTTTVHYLASKEFELILAEVHKISLAQEAGDTASADKLAKALVKRIRVIEDKWKEYQKQAEILEARRRDLSLAIDHTATLRRLMSGDKSAQNRLQKAIERYRQDSSKYDRDLWSGVYVADMNLLKDCDGKITAMLQAPQKNLDAALESFKSADFAGVFDFKFDWLWDRIDDTRARLQSTMEMLQATRLISEPFHQELERQVKAANITDPQKDSEKLWTIALQVAEKMLAEASSKKTEK